MPSSVIRAFDYDEARNELTVTFTTGRIYVYLLVPPPLVDEFRQASSKGRFFNAAIRDAFPYREAKPGAVRLVRRASARNISRSGGSRNRG
jgi:hypothetical protein